MAESPAEINAPAYFAPSDRQTVIEGCGSDAPSILLLEDFVFQGDQRNENQNPELGGKGEDQGERPDGGGLAEFHAPQRRQPADSPRRSDLVALAEFRIRHCR